MKKLGIVCGGGELPKIVMTCAEKEKYECHIIGIHGYADNQWLKQQNGISLAIGEIGKIIAHLKALNITKIVLVGTLPRPNLSSLLLDNYGRKLLKEINQLARKGDDDLLRVVSSFFNGQGIEILEIENIIGSASHVAGALGKLPLLEAITMNEISTAMAELFSASPEVGQAAIAKAGKIIAFEDDLGTDALLEEMAGNIDLQKTKPAFLIKMRKPRQMQGVDLPTIGPETIIKAAKAGLKGIVIDAGGTIIINKSKVIAEANKLGLFIVAVAQSDATTPLAKSKNIFMLAGEQSGDNIGASIIKALRLHYDGDISFFGVGGHKMSANGLSSLFPYNELAIIGIFNAIVAWLRLTRLRNKLILEILRKKPDVCITIDAQEFAKNLAQKLQQKAPNISKIHIGAPTVWAWRANRAKTYAKIFQHLAVFFPFEKAYFPNMSCTYVGHPIGESQISHKNKNEFREIQNVANNARLLVVACGSRKSEARALAPIFAETVRKLRKAIPNLHVAVSEMPATKQYIDQQDWHGEIIRFPFKQRYQAYMSANAALCASGTISLELATLETPHVVAYKMGWISGLLKRFLYKQTYVSMLNIIENKEVIPELIQVKCNTDNLVNAVSSLLTTDAANAQLQQFKPIIGSLMLAKGEFKRRIVEIVNQELANE